MAERERRRLTTILAADVVGYSRLVGADEEGTLRRLRQLRAELFDPAIENNGGRVFKRTGDGILAEFTSVVDAVRCANTRRPSHFCAGRSRRTAITRTLISVSPPHSRISAASTTQILWRKRG
ncbi:MAG TPA: hypothetical protein VMF86_16100 [Stellaceae bacterium]|nr:hypothetical protein [Stellaceae bacterium]